MTSPERDPLFIPGALEEVDMHFLPHDANSGEAQLQAEELPWSPEDYALNQVSLALELDEDQIDDMGFDERQRYIAIIQSVTSCIITTTDTDISVMSVHTIKDLQQLAQRATDPTGFLQDFASFAATRKASIEGEQGQPAAPNANEFYVKSMGRFLRRHTDTHLTAN